jgi:enamine deaminase RidA (YjgF/YER057c/UK114 family)
MIERMELDRINDWLWCLRTPVVQAYAVPERDGSNPIDTSTAGEDGALLDPGHNNARTTSASAVRPGSQHSMRRHISSGSPLERAIGFSRAVRDGHLVFVSATAAIWPDGHVDPEVGVQARRCLQIIGEALRESGATLADVVRTRVFLVDAAHGDAVAQVHGKVFGEIRPATGFIVVQGFLDPRWLVEIEADAVVGR